MGWVVGVVDEVADRMRFRHLPVDVVVLLNDTLKEIRIILRTLLLFRNLIANTGGSFHASNQVLLVMEAAISRAQAY